MSGVGSPRLRVQPPTSRHPTPQVAPPRSPAAFTSFRRCNFLAGAHVHPQIRQPDPPPKSSARYGSPMIRLGGAVEQRQRRLASLQDEFRSVLAIRWCRSLDPLPQPPALASGSATRSAAWPEPFSPGAGCAAAPGTVASPQDPFSSSSPASRGRSRPIGGSDAASRRPVPRHSGASLAGEKYSAGTVSGGNKRGNVVRARTRASFSFPRGGRFHAPADEA